MDKTTGAEVLSPDGSLITAEKTFTAESAEGAVELVFTVNSNALAGKTIVAFEDLSNEYGVIATHKDLTDENQTAYIPELRTVFAGKGGEKVFLAGGSQTIIDTVAFKGLLPSDEEDYKLVAVLMDKTTGSELLQPDGTPVTAEVIFSPKESEGTVDVTFSLEGCEIYSGKTIVAFETLYYKDEEVAEHARLLSVRFRRKRLSGRSEAYRYGGLRKPDSGYRLHAGRNHDGQKNGTALSRQQCKSRDFIGILYSGSA